MHYIYMPPISLLKNLGGLQDHKHRDIKQTKCYFHVTNHLWILVAEMHGMDHAVSHNVLIPWDILRLFSSITENLIAALDISL